MATAIRKITARRPDRYAETPRAHEHIRSPARCRWPVEAALAGGVARPGKSPAVCRTAQRRAMGIAIRGVKTEIRLNWSCGELRQLLKSAAITKPGDFLTNCIQ